MQEGLRKGQDEELRPMVEAMLQEVGANHVGFLKVKRDRIVLKPGEKRTAKATFELPQTLIPHRHYRANLEPTTPF